MSKFSKGNWVRVTCPHSTISDEVGQVRNISRERRGWQYTILVDGVAFGPMDEWRLTLAEEPASVAVGYLALSAELAEGL